METPQHRKLVKHYDGDEDAHFLTFSCYQRLPLLSKVRTRYSLIDALEKARLTHQFDLWAWVIMPEHVHLLIWPQSKEYETDKVLWSIKQPVATKAIRFLEEFEPEFLDCLRVVNRGRTYRHIWQVGPGYDVNLDEPQSIHDTIDYIHYNPVRRGLVTRPEDWFWSSARDFAGFEDLAPIRVDRTAPTLYISQS